MWGWPASCCPQIRDYGEPLPFHILAAAYLFDLAMPEIVARNHVLLVAVDRATPGMASDRASICPRRADPLRELLGDDDVVLIHWDPLAVEEAARDEG